MSLTRPQVQSLVDSASAYAFQPAYFDFARGLEVEGLTMTELEAAVKKKLQGGIESEVKDGLANVLYWGFAQMGGLKGVRAEQFRSKVTQQQLEDASNLFMNHARPSLEDIAKLKLPQFSGVSFVSKVRMFLDPEGSATLDRQIMKIHKVCPTTVLAAVRESKTSIPVTHANSNAYELWCAGLEKIRSLYVPSLRVVDVERGLFNLVQCDQVNLAAQILNDV